MKIKSLKLQTFTMTNNSLPFFIIQEAYNVQHKMSWEKMAKCMKNPTHNKQLDIMNIQNIDNNKKNKKIT
jgi:hypothetical protein